MNSAPGSPPLPIVVLISGSGTNLQAIIDSIAHAALPAVIRAVISNNRRAGGLKRAAKAGIATEVLEHTNYPNRAQFEAALLATVDRYSPQLVVLAGFMRVLGKRFVEHYRGRLLNIHPSLLPDFPGLDTHRRALDAGVPEHGVSVHFVSEEVDGGPVVMQARVPVLPGDEPSTLAARVLEREHQVYPLVIKLYAQGRLRLVDDGIKFDGRRLEHPLDPADIEQDASRLGPKRG